MSDNSVFKSCIGTFSYVTVFKPRFDDNRVDRDTGEPVPIYSTQFIFPKKEKAFITSFNKAVKAAVKKGVEKGMWNAAAEKLLKKPLRDGDDELAAGQVKDPIYKRCYFFNAVTTKEPPDVLKAAGGEVVAIDVHAELYSGCKGRLLGSCYPFKNQSKGIAVGLNALFKTGEGKRLDGRPDAKSAFSKFAEEVGDTDLTEEEPTDIGGEDGHEDFE